MKIKITPILCFAPLRLCVKIILLIFIAGCEKEIDIEVPEAEPALVVEGRIETGQPPFIILSKSAGYFEAADISSYENSFVHNAEITVTVDNINYSLPEFCLSNLPPSLLPLAAQFLGVKEENLVGVNYCIYTVPLADLFTGNFLKGENGKFYSLTIKYLGKTYTSYTKIPNPVPLDSVWFAFDGTDTTFGFAWAHLTDPDTSGNGYRWFAKRINIRANGKPKDEYYIAPLGSAFDDKFINEKSFDFGFDRGHRPSDEFMDDEPGEKQHYYKYTDTIAIKFCSIENTVFRFIRQYETEIWNNGNPFASPSSIPTNITGGAFGLWAGYAVSHDTIYGGK